MRLLSGTPQQQFAIACGISNGYLSNIEAGRKQPADDLVKRLANELGVDLHEITYVVSSEAIFETKAVAA